MRSACLGWIRAGAVLSALWLAAGTAAAAQPAPSREYQIKAAFLFNFAHFVEWPPRSFATPQAPLIIGVLGADPFGPYLDAFVQGERAHDRPLVIQRYRRVKEATECQILFISQSESGRLEQDFAALQDRSVLTVGDADGFAERGGMIRFFTDSNNHIRLRINLDAAKSADLVLSSKLLRPAEVVAGAKERP